MRSTMMDAPLQVSRILEHGGDRARRRRGGHLDRRGAPPDDVRGGGAGRRPAGARAARRVRGHRRPAGGDLHVEQRRAPGGVLRGAEHGRGAAHAQHPALPRPGRLHRQPRRGPGGAGRPHAHPAAGEGARRADHRAARRGRRRRRPGRRCGPPPATGSPCTTGTSCSPAGRRRTTGRSWTSATPPPSATPPGPPATRRALPTRTVRSSCTRCRSACRRGSGSGPTDRELAIVPMFHAMSWGLPYAAFLSGASLIMPDRFLQAAPIADDDRRASGRRWPARCRPSGATCCTTWTDSDGTPPRCGR